VPAWQGAHVSSLAVKAGSCVASGLGNDPAAHGCVCREFGAWRVVCIVGGGGVISGNFNEDEPDTVRPPFKEPGIIQQDPHRARRRPGAGNFGRAASHARRVARRALGRQGRVHGAAAEEERQVLQVLS
jgi:hypothetical protein